MADWIEAAEEFCSCLRSPSSAAVFQDSFRLTTLPDPTLSPFAPFTGRLRGPTVVVGAHDPEAQEDAKPLPLRSYKLVNTSQPLSHNRQFLCQAESFYPGRAGGCCGEMCVVSADAGFRALSLDRARYVVSLFSVACSAALLEGPLSVWVYCHGAPVAVLGAAYDCGSLRCYQLHFQRSLSEEEAHSKMTKKISRPLSSVFSEYAITEEEYSSSGRLVVQFGWTDADSWLSPPPESADAVLRLSVTPGSHLSPVLACYQELSALLHLCKVEQGTADWHGSGEPLLSSHTASFLEELSSPSLQPLPVAVLSPSAELAVYKPRQDLDFAEQLWVFAKDVQSMEDLQQLMAGVFKAVLLGQVEPFIHKGSKSTLAVLFRQVLLSGSPEHRQALAPRFQTLLSSSNLISCLAQLGIEKMNRDYRCFFVGSDVLSAQYFDDFIREVSAPSASLLEQCEQQLCSMHTVLELTGSLLAFLNLPAATLTSLAKAALEECRRTPESCGELAASPVFALPLPAYSPGLKSVVALCANLAPSQWSGSDNSSSMTLVTRTPFSSEEPTNTAAASYWEYTASCTTVM